MIPILLIFTAVLIIALHDCIKQRDINYSNYQNALLALGEYDPKLKAYMKENER